MATSLDSLTADGLSAVTLIVKAPNQKVEDKRIACDRMWTVAQLKEHLSTVYPEKPHKDQQKLVYFGKLLKDESCLHEVLTQDSFDDAHTVHLVCPARAAIKETPKQHVTRFTSAPQSQVPPNLPELRQRHQPATRQSEAQSEQSTVPNNQPYLEQYAVMWQQYIQLQQQHLSQSSLSPQQKLWWQAYYQQSAHYNMQMTAYMNAGAINALPATGTDQPDTEEPAAVQPEEAANGNNDEDVVMNAQGGVDADVRPNDWLDTLYALTRFAMLMMLLYFYTTFGRFTVVLAVGFFFYLAQGNFFRLQRRRVAVPVPQNNPPVNEQNQAENQNNENNERDQNVNGENAEPNNNNIHPIRQQQEQPEMDQRDGSDNGPKGTYEIYRAEGDALFKQGNYKKAIESYTAALEIREGDRACLVARSKCHLQLGDNTRALDDAETSLSDEPEYHKGIFAKAEALYCKGEFELSLVYYHRGNKLRPELQEFRLGIQKAREAIDNAVGTPDAVTLTKDGDLSFFAKQDEKAKPKKPGASFTYGRATQQSEQKKRPPPKSGSEKTVKQLLGELYGDKEFLERLLKDTDTSSKNGQQIYDLACDGLHYLDTRTDFWRQQKPMYSRKREKQEKRGKQKKGNHEQHVMSQLERIDNELMDGHFDESLKRARKCLTYVQGLTEKDLSNHKEITANLYSCIGNAYLEMGKYKEALQNHNKDLDIANDNDLQEAKSRALDNLGRVHARSGEFAKAIEVWEDKLPMSKSALESTWLYHEIGRCYLETGRLEKALELGEKAAEAAEEADDDEWKLHAGVLMSQALVRSKDYSRAVDSFERTLDLAKVMGDETAEIAIKAALNDVNKKIAQETHDKGRDSAAVTETNPDQEREKTETPPEGEEQQEKADQDKPAEEVEG